MEVLRFQTSFAFLMYQKIVHHESNGPSRCAILEESPGYTFHMYTSLLDHLCIHLNSIKLTDFVNDR